MAASCYWAEDMFGNVVGTGGGASCAHNILLGKLGCTWCTIRCNPFQKLELVEHVRVYTLLDRLMGFILLLLDNKKTI